MKETLCFLVTARFHELAQPARLISGTGSGHHCMRNSAENEPWSKFSRYREKIYIVNSLVASEDPPCPCSWCDGCRQSAMLEAKTKAPACLLVWAIMSERGAAFL